MTNSYLKTKTYPIYQNRKKTEEQVFEHIETFTEDLLRKTYPRLTSLDPYKDIAAMLMNECKSDIKREMRRKRLDGLVLYRATVSLEKRQIYFMGSLQFALWEMCGLAVEEYMSKLETLSADQTDKAGPPPASGETVA